MNTLSAFAKSLASQREQRVFDWDKAARLIKEKKPLEARAGLGSDWEWTAGTIYKDGQIVDEYTYLSSNWATPQLELDGEVIDCFTMEDKGWDACTKWPDSALKILESE